MILDIMQHKYTLAVEWKRTTSIPFHLAGPEVGYQDSGGIDGEVEREAKLDIPETKCH
jgi:hypothetical protein